MSGGWKQRLYLLNSWGNAGRFYNSPLQSTIKTVLLTSVFLRMKKNSPRLFTVVAYFFSSFPLVCLFSCILHICTVLPSWANAS